MKPKKIIFLSALLFLQSCINGERSIVYVKLPVDSCVEVPKISIHDQIQSTKWRVYSGNRRLVSNTHYQKGDSIVVKLIKSK
jgi:hypothetical protein